MNCDRALISLLDAELPGLAAGTTTLAAHVRGCARCRRVADQLMADTHLLAGAIPATVARRRTSISIAPLAVAASLLVMVAIQRQGATPVATVAAVLSPVVIEPAISVARVDPVAVSPAPRLTAREFPRAVPVVAARMDASGSVIAEPAVTIPTRTVSVTPPAGTRAVVMQTSDPKLVVVWLY